MRYVSHDRRRVGSSRVSATGAGCHSYTTTGGGEYASCRSYTSTDRRVSSDYISR